MPLLYVGFAHISLAVAFTALAVDPRAAAGFFYHPRMLAIVHLVTLGWISMSIVGALYVVMPVALCTAMRAGRSDVWIWVNTAIGVAGMVSHFWIEEYSGMAWSAAMVTGGLAYVGARSIRALSGAPVSGAIKCHVILAFVNLLVAAVIGVLLGFDKLYSFLPGYTLTNVYAHAHLAAIGWAGMLVVGIGYRLLPMVLPSDMPVGRHLYVSAVLLEAGALGLFAGFVLRSPWTAAFAGLAASGFATFLAVIVWMRRHARRPPATWPRPDVGLAHVRMSLVYLLLSLGCGLVLAVAAPSAWTLRLVMAYGVMGLVGFLAQMVLGMQTRLLPLLAWYWASARAGSKDGAIPAPLRLASRPLQYGSFWLWTAGVPLLVIGLFGDVTGLIRTGGALLLASLVLAGANVVVVVRHAFLDAPAAARAPTRAALPGP